eukprot:1191545-Prorocentrum_minimum.AAC.4
MPETQIPGTRAPHWSASPRRRPIGRGFRTQDSERLNAIGCFPPTLGGRQAVLLREILPEILDKRALLDGSTRRFPSLACD